MNADDIRKLAGWYAGLNNELVPNFHDTAEVLRACADIADQARKFRPHNHAATFVPSCQLCQAIARLDALKP